jgi:periplasmic protein TonB
METASIQGAPRMEAVMKRIVFAAASVAACVVTPAAAQMPDMTQHEAVTFAQWRDRVQAELATNIHYPRAMAGRSLENGLVRIKFNCSDTGRADKVTLARTSGSSQLDRAALAAVSRISSLHPLPADFAHGQAFQAMVMFYTGSDDDYRRKIEKIRAEASQMNAHFGSTQIALVSTAPSGGR